jgi:hypothetical protein
MGGNSSLAVVNSLLEGGNSSLEILNRDLNNCISFGIQIWAGRAHKMAEIAHKRAGIAHKWVGIAH